MTLKAELAHELEITRQNFHHLLDSVPEALYAHPSDNPAWTIGDVFYHITLGPPAIRVEIWMMCHVNKLFQLVMNDGTAKVFNWGNALFARQGGRFSKRTLSNAYEKSHARIIRALEHTNENDFQKSIVYPALFVPEIAGEVTVERLFRYVKLHFYIHAEQINGILKDAR